MNKAVILLSGGLDSATVLAIAKRDGFTPYALSFDYGQRHQFELDSARRQAELQGAAEHQIMQIGLGGFGGSALTDEAVAVPQPGSVEAIDSSQEIPVTYVPARNTVFLSFALGWAEVLGADDIFIGANALDYSGYPDCRPEYLEAFERLGNLATARWVSGEASLKIHAPLLHKTKAETVEIGLSLGVDYGATHSCYAPDETGHPCGACDACLLRARGFEQAGATDPAL